MVGIRIVPRIHSLFDPVGVARNFMSRALVTRTLGCRRASIQAGNTRIIKSSNEGLARALNRFRADGWMIAHYGFVYDDCIRETFEQFELTHANTNKKIPLSSE